MEPSDELVALFGRFLGRGGSIFVSWKQDVAEALQAAFDAGLIVPADEHKRVKRQAEESRTAHMQARADELRLRVEHERVKAELLRASRWRHDSVEQRTGYPWNDND